MALDRSKLVEELRKIADQEFQLFEEFPKTNLETADRWASAIDTYANKVIPSSTTSNEAKQSFIQVMKQVSPAVDGITLLTQAIVNYATTLSIGMLPSFNGTPSITPLILSSISTIGLSGGSSRQCCELLATLIDQWFKSGIAINTTTGTPVNWN